MAEVPDPAPTSAKRHGDPMPSDANALEEWREARQIITGIDDKLQALRTFGPTFLTALLTAQGLTEIPLASSTGFLPPSAKLVIVLASDLLILSLFVMERPLRLVQQASARRAIELESTMGMFLTKAISNTYQARHPWNYIDVVYSLFLVATGALGFFILNPSSVTIDAPTVVDLAATIVALGFVWAFGRHTSSGRAGT